MPHRDLAAGRLVLLGVLLLAVPAGEAWGGRKVAQTFHDEFEFTGGEIVVRNSRGGIVLLGNGESDLVVVSAEKMVYASSEEKANRFIKRIEIRRIVEGDRLLIEVDYPDRREDGSFLKHIFGGGTRARVELEVIVPSTVSATVVTASADVSISSLTGDFVKVDGSSGDVEIEEIDGNVEADVSSGDVVMRGIRGNVSIEGTSGDLGLSGIQGNLWATVSSGDIEARGVEGIIDARTQSGNLEIRDCSGDIELKGSSGDVVVVGAGGNIDTKTSSGDVSIRVTPVDGREYGVTTASGDVDFSYYAGAGYRLLVRTASGTISAMIPIDISTISRSTLEGQVGQGEAVIRIETASGDVDVVELEGRKEARERPRKRNPGGRPPRR